MPQIFGNSHVESISMLGSRQVEAPKLRKALGATHPKPELKAHYSLSLSLYIYIYYIHIVYVCVYKYMYIYIYMNPTPRVKSTLRVATGHPELEMTAHDCRR